MIDLQQLEPSELANAMPALWAAILEDDNPRTDVARNAGWDREYGQSDPEIPEPERQSSPFWLADGHGDEEPRRSAAPLDTATEREWDPEYELWTAEPPSATASVPQATRDAWVEGNQPLGTWKLTL